ncbi:MAG: hypothetical protein FWC68_03665 [Oscillospiraceae bacterium]|nr:hypothetical protein [Oscillospiraceae bacterium]
MSIQRVYKNKKIDVLDEQGNKIGEVCFNPEDVGAYDAFLNILDKIVESQRKVKDIGEIEDFTDEEIENLKGTEDLEGLEDTFSKMKAIFQITVDLVDEINKDIDSIFGEGITELFLQGSKDIELLMPLLDGVMPIFQEAREQKTDKYLNKPKNDVMA